MRNEALNTDEHQYSPLPWLLRPDDVAEFCQVSTKTVLRAIRGGRLRAYRLGKRNAYRIRPDDVEAWLQSCPVRGRTRNPVEETVLPRPPRERGRLIVDDGEVTGA
jgi:excisionase family DNA binding protein